MVQIVRRMIGLELNFEDKKVVIDGNVQCFLYMVI